MSWRQQSAWMKRRACRGMDPGPWFSSRTQDVADARKVCDACPVQAVCLSWALEEEGELRQVERGMFGGKTPAERREMLGLKPLRPSRAAARPGMTATRTLEVMEAERFKGWAPSTPQAIVVKVGP